MFTWIFVLLFSLASAPPPPSIQPPIQDVNGLLNKLADYGLNCNHLFNHKDDPKTETRRECFDGKDNDEDGHTDCEDPDCSKDPRIRQRCTIMTRKNNKD